MFELSAFRLPSLAATQKSATTTRTDRREIIKYTRHTKDNYGIWRFLDCVGLGSLSSGYRKFFVRLYHAQFGCASSTTWEQGVRPDLNDKGLELNIKSNSPWQIVTSSTITTKYKSYQRRAFFQRIAGYTKQISTLKRGQKAKPRSGAPLIASYLGPLLSLHAPLEILPADLPQI